MLKKGTLVFFGLKFLYLVNKNSFQLVKNMKFSKKQLEEIISSNLAEVTEIFKSKTSVELQRVEDYDSIGVKAVVRFDGLEVDESFIVVNYKT